MQKKQQERRRNNSTTPKLDRFKKHRQQCPDNKNSFTTKCHLEKVRYNLDKYFVKPDLPSITHFEEPSRNGRSLLVYEDARSNVTPFGACNYIYYPQNNLLNIVVTRKINWRLIATHLAVDNRRTHPTNVWSMYQESWHRQCPLLNNHYN